MFIHITNILKTLFHKERTHQLCIVVLSVLSLFPLIMQIGLPEGDSLHLEMIRIVEFKEAFLQQGLPRWAPDLYFGYGSPIFLYYAPLFSFISSLFLLLTQSLDWSIRLALLLIITIGNLACFQFLRLYFDRRTSWWGTLFFIFAPYKATNIFMRNAFAEVTAFSTFPLFLYFLGGYIKEQKAYFLIGLFLSISLFAISHPALLLLSAFLFLFLGIVLFVSYLRGSLSKEIGMGLLIATVLGFLSTSWFLIPALTQTQLVRPDDLTGNGILQYASHFIHFDEVFFSFSAFLSISSAPFLFLLGAGILLFKNRTEKDTIWYIALISLVTSLFYTFLMSGYSVLLWEYIPKLAFVQFPWRALSLLSFLCIPACAYVIQQLWKNTLGTSVLVGILVMMIYPYTLHATDKHYKEVSASFTPSNIAFQNHRATYLDEFLPKTAVLAKSVSTKSYYIPNNSGTKKISSTTYESCGNFPARTDVDFPVFNFPLWKGYLDGKETPTDQTSSLVRIQTPPGEHCLQIRLGWLPIQILSIVVSILSVLGFGWFIWRRRKA